MGDSRLRFPWWILGGAMLLSLAYLPTLRAPFDFIDDGDLVYPATHADGTSLTLREHGELWWNRVCANVEHLGPFRPVLWAQWQLQANLWGADAVAWRLSRLAWCAFASAMLLWLFRELGIAPPAALIAGAAAMWNPYRNEIWMSLTLSEGVAMPYALLSLVAARKAATSERGAWRWDAVGIVGVLLALGCKNTFAAIVPAQLVLRFWREDCSLLASLWQSRWRVALFALPLALPVAHFAYFQINWRPGHYDASFPRFAQLSRFVLCLKGASGLEFVGAGIAASLVVLRVRGVLRFAWSPAMACGLTLLVAGTVVYLPVGIISGRYAMPAVWGFDILFALLLSAIVTQPGNTGRAVACGAVCAGIAVVLLLNVHRQDRAANRSRMLWEVVRHIETHAEPGSVIEWRCGDPATGGLGAEEAIHLQWHLRNRGVADVRVRVVTDRGETLSRAELLAVEGEATLRVSAIDTPEPRWKCEQTFAAYYQLGRKHYSCGIYRRSLPPVFANDNDFAKLFMEQVIPPPRVWLPWW
jgi:hypothetical protein